MNPKCVDKNQQNRCPEGQSISTASKDKPGKCAPDPEPDKRCQNNDDYVHKDIGPDGKIKNSCRLNREKEEKKNSGTNSSLRNAKEKVMAPIRKAEKERTARYVAI